MPVEVADEDVLIVTAEAREPREVAGPRRDESVLRRASWRGGAEGERVVGAMHTDVQKARSGMHTIRNVFKKESSALLLFQDTWLVGYAKREVHTIQ